MSNESTQRPEGTPTPHSLGQHPDEWDTHLVDGQRLFLWTPTNEYVTLDEWEARNAVRAILDHIGEDVDREGLLDTPKRVAKAYREMTTGYAEDPAVILGTTFDVTCDELVMVKDIEFVSLCEHHMLPFTGTATLGYLPGARVVGLSKLGRVVDTFARRLQVQERMTVQIAHALEEHLGARGVAVVIRGTHSCMALRGVRKSSQMVTSSMLGQMRDDPVLRGEFLALSK